MSTSPDTDFDLDLQFLPSWAQKPADQNRYANYQGETERRDSRGDRPFRPGQRRDQGGRGPGRPGQQPNRGPRSGQGPGRPERRGEDRRRGGEMGGGGRRPEQGPLAPPVALPEINIAFVPDDKGVDSLARQIKMTGRAYPLFDIAQMVLQKPERHTLTFTSKKKPDGSVAQALFVCALDDSLWLAEQEAVDHVLNKHFTTFYQPEKTQIEPPKGVYTFVAQCGLSGIILGPPNYHDYQIRLHKLHSERFSRMPFDAYKSRVKIVRDEAIVKKWQEDQSWKTEYVCLNVPEPLKLPNREEVENHFRQVHLANIIKQVETYQLTGTAARQLRCSGLTRLVRHMAEEQRRFPLQIATVLSQQFATRGLQFFKVNKTVTHVAVARPHYLDLELTPVSDGIRRIVEFINGHAKCTRKLLVDTLAPFPKAATQPKPVPAAEPAPASAEASTPEGAPSPVPAAPPAPEPSPEATAIISDLHWLIHQGHVIEFANGLLETAKKPLPRPPKREPSPKVSENPAPAASGPAGTASGATASEGIAQPEASVSSGTEEMQSVPAASVENEASAAPAEPQQQA
ncbi:MAG TPA: hypothetical protein VMZ27_12500 [Candidatus Saccharimonadales bacterium]|nr:hypothetical protein [Candidatus Saccharimonadales bacterium]